MTFSEPWCLGWGGRHDRGAPKYSTGRLGYGTERRGRRISRETVEQLLRDILREEAKKRVTIDQIQKKVAEHFDVRIAEMTGKRRTSNFAFPRQVAMYLARRHTKATLHEIGETFGGRDHGTVLHACKTVSVRMEKEDQVRQAILRLDTQLER
jgi:chromosomal replication initiator protein